MLMGSSFKLYQRLKRLLNFKSLTPFGDTCKNCGYKFKFDNPIRVDSINCEEKLLSMSYKRRIRLAKKYKRNPLKCPICNRKVFLGAGPRAKLCPKCGYLEE